MVLVPPERAETCINVDAFEGAINKVFPRMTLLQQEKARLVISDLRSGVDTLINPSLLPSKTVENSTLSQDTLASWVKKGFVSGPYDSPPAEGFRSNRLSPLSALENSDPYGTSLLQRCPASMTPSIHSGSRRLSWPRHAPLRISSSIGAKTPTSQSWTRAQLSSSCLSGQL